MSEKPDNPPAFPSGRMEGYEPAQFPQYEGMTLRDYFAGQMGAAMLQATTQTAQNLSGKALIDVNEIATRSYTMADAMLRARREP